MNLWLINYATLTVWGKSHNKILSRIFRISKYSKIMCHIHQEFYDAQETWESGVQIATGTTINFEANNKFLSCMVFFISWPLKPLNRHYTDILLIIEGIVDLVVGGVLIWTPTSTTGLPSPWLISEAEWIKFKTHV